MTNSLTAPIQQDTDIMAALLADGRFTLGYPKRGAIVSGEIVGITKEGAWVNLGTKADSLLPADELKENTLEVGQRVDFFVVSEPNEDGQAMLSLKAARSWSELRNLLETNATETVTITKVIRSKANDHIAGAIASIRGQRGFIPASQLSGRRDTLDKAVGTTVPVKVIAVDPVERKLILSQRKAEAEMRDSFFASVQKGDIVSGRVVNLVDFGAFVDLGCGVTGLVHRSEIGNRSSAKPSELLAVGQELELLVLNVNPETKKVDLSLKQVAQARVLSTLSKGQVVEGTVARFMEYGAFIDLGGIDGLLHNSELPGDSPRSRPSAKDVLSIGQTIKLVVIELNVESRKVGLSLRQLPKAAAEQA